LNIAAKTFVEELENLVSSENLIRSHEPFIFLFVKLLCIISLNFGK
jgi:hypothetical protein